MPQKLLQTSTKMIPEQVDVSIRTLKDTDIVLANTANTIIDCSRADYVRVNLQADTEISLSNGTREGQQLVLAIYQHDAMPHTVTFDMSTIRLGSDIWSIPKLSETKGKLDRLIFMFDSVSGKYDLVGYSRGY